MATQAHTHMTTKATRLADNLGQFYYSANVKEVLADKHKQGQLSYRLATLSHTYGVPVAQICKMAKINKNIAALVLNGAFDNKHNSIPAARLAKVLSDLERTLPLLDKNYYRPRTWTEALALCMQHA